MKTCLHFRDLYMEGEKIFFSAVEINGLFRIKKGENTAEFISEFSGEDFFQPNLHSQLIQYENKLYFIPLNGHGIDVYCMNEMKMETIPYESENSIQIIRAYLLDSDIVLIPFNFKTPFLIFHIKDYSYERIDYIENTIYKIIKREDYWMDTFSTALNGEILYIALPGTNILLECDLKKRDVRIRKFDGDIRLNAIEYFDGELFLSAMGTSDVYVYRMKDGKTREIEAGLPLGNDEKENIVLTDGLSLYAVSPYFIARLNNLGNGFEKIVDISEKFRKRGNGYRLFAGKRIIDNAVWLFSASGGGTLCLKRNELTLYEILAVSEMEDQISFYQSKWLKAKMGTNRCIVENQCDNVGLKIFIDMVLHEAEEKKNSATGQSGNSIWESLVDSM